MRKAVNHLKKSDPIMATIIERVGPLRITYREPVFETLVRSIVFQQLSGKASLTIFNRLNDLCGGSVTPDAIQNLTVGEMRRAGLSKQKIGYIRDLAEHALSGELDFTRISEMTDEEVIVALTQVKGIGVWTAHMFLMFALRRPNILPIGDLGIQNAVKRAYNKRKKVTPKHVEKHGKLWHPYCSIATWYLWRSLELK